MISFLLHYIPLCWAFVLLWNAHTCWKCARARLTYYLSASDLIRALVLSPVVVPLFLLLWLVAEPESSQR